MPNKDRAKHRIKNEWTLIVHTDFKFFTDTIFFFTAAAAAAAAAVNKDKAWTLGNGNRLKKSSLTSGGSGGSGNREKQMPVRPRSVNSALESKPIRGSSNINVSGGNKILGYATLGNDRTNNGTRSFHDNSLIGNGSSNYAR